MSQKTKDHYFYAAFHAEAPADVSNCIGTYTFNVIGRDARGQITTAPLYGLCVKYDDDRVKFVYDGGDPPSAKAGRALDLHQAATALLRAHAMAMTAPLAFFITDAGKVGSCDLGEYMTVHVPAFAHDLPSLDRGSSALQAGSAVASPPSPPVFMGPSF